MLQVTKTLKRMEALTKVERAKASKRAEQTMAAPHIQTERQAITAKETEKHTMETQQDPT